MRGRGLYAACLAAAGLVAAAPSASAAGAGDDARAARHTVRITTTVDPSERGRALPRNFLGFSYEYERLHRLIGFSATGVNTAFAGLIRNLTRTGSGAPVLRIGGGSQDAMWWNPTERPRPFGIDFDLTQEYIEAVGAFARYTHMPTMFGLNLVQRDRRIARDATRALMRHMPRGTIRSFEVGNEPNFYPTRPLGERNGRLIYSRPRGYDHRHWLSEMGRMLRSLSRMRPRPPLAGPSSTCSPEWCGDALNALLRRHSRHLEEITFHTYATTVCQPPGEPPRRPRRGDVPPTIPALLSNEALREIRLYRPAIAAARQRGLGVRVTESNTAVCGGKPGVSDTFASALWAIDWMFLLAANGASGINFHGTSRIYAPITSGLTQHGWLANARPLYYGMLFFAEATARRARVLVRPSLAARSSKPANIRLWATMDRRRTARVVVNNKDSRDATVRIRIPGARRTGTVTRLAAPSIDAAHGVTLGGRSVPTPSADGQLTGTEQLDLVRSRRGVYHFRVPAGQAAYLTVRRVPRARSAPRPRRGSR